MKAKNTQTFALIICLIIVVITFLSFVSFKDKLQNSIHLDMQLTAENHVSQMDGWLMNKASVLRTLVSWVRQNGIDDLAQYPTDNPYLQVNADDNYVDRPFVGLKDGRFLTGGTWVPGKEYDPRKRDWYKEAMENRVLGFSTPYVDADSFEFTVSAIAPLYGPTGELEGVIGEDIFLDTLKNELTQVQVSNSGYGFLYDQNGFILSHPNTNYITRKITEVPFFHEIQSGTEVGNGVISFTHNGQTLLVYLKQLPSTGWTMGVVVEQDVVYQPVNTAFGQFLMINVVALALIFVLSRYFVKMEIELNRYSEEISETALKYEHAKAEAEDAQLTKAMFTGALRKDVTATLQGIKGMTEYLGNQPAFKDHRGDIDVLGESVVSLSNQIDEFVQYSVSEGSPFEIQTDVIQIDRIMDIMDKMYGHLLSSADIKFAMDKHDAVPSELIGDKTRMLHLLTSMLSATFQTEGVNDIRVLFLYLDHTLTVRMSIGQQGDAQVNEEQLVIPKMVAKQMDGEILHKERMLVLNLPLYEVEKLNPAHLKENIVSQDAMPMDASGVTAMVIENQEVGSTVLSLLLQTLHIQVEQVQALPLPNEVLPPVAFIRMDMEWSERDLDQIRRLNEKWFSVAIVQGDQMEQRQKAIELGFDTTLEQPLSREKVQTRMKLYQMKKGNIS